MNFLANQSIKWYALLKFISHTIQFSHLRYSTVFRIFTIVRPQTQSTLHFQKFRREIWTIRDHSHYFQSSQVWGNNNLLLIVCVLTWSGENNLPAKQTQRSRRCRFHPWVGKVPWRKSWQPTPVFLPGDFPGGATVHSVIKSQIQLKRLCTAQPLPVLDISYKQNHAICDLS